MPFNEAKKIVEKQIAPKIEERGIQMNVAYSLLVKKFDDHTKKANKYLAHANYPGHNKDKQDYLAQIRKSTDKFLKKKGKLEEFLKYINNVDIKSDQLHKTIGEKIKKQENEKFKELSLKNISLVQKGNFDDAISNMLALNMHLSPFSRTDKSGNIGETFLRVDKKIEDTVNRLKEQKKLTSELFVKGTVLKTKNEEVSIDGIENGIVTFKSNDPKTKNAIQKVNWLKFLNKYKPGSFKIIRNSKEIDIKTDPKLAESKAHIAELKMLKQINFFYSGSLEKFAKNPAERKLLKNALEENLATMGLYFDRNADGTVTPTKIYKMLPQTMKVKKLAGMMQGFQRIRMRMSLEEKAGKIDKDKNPSQHRFLKAEIDFQNGLHLPAYAKFKKYIKNNKDDSDEVIKKQVKHAKGRLKQSSFYVINLAQRYSMACIQEPHGSKSKFHLSDGFREKVIKKLSKVFSQLRQSMQSGKAADLDQAYAQLKDKPEGGLGVKVKEFGARGLTETNFLRRHFSFVKTMITTVSTLQYGDNQEEALDLLGDRAREDKLRGGARVLYEEQMKRKLIKRRRELMKDPKYREKERKRFLALSSGDRKELAFEEVVNIFGKSLEKNIPGIMRGAKAATKTLSAAADHITDYFTETELFVDKDDDKPLSKYEDISPFGPTAGIMRRAIQDAGGLGKYQALSLPNKKEFFESAKMKILLGKHENNEHTKNVNAYVKGVMSEEGSMSELTNSVAYKFNDTFDPNNEFFNLSDEGWDFVESLVGEVPIMAASGGVGNLAALGVKQGAKYAAKKLMQTALKRTLQSTALRLGVRGTAFAADLAVSEVVDRGIRYITRGEKPPMDIAQLLAHSIGTYGSMKYASKGGQRLLQGVAEKGMVGKMASHAISTAAIEAPCMMAVNTLFGQTEGTMLEQYGRALGTMLASKGSMSMLHSSTGRVMIKAEQNYDTRDSMNKIQDPWKKKIINEMVTKNEVNIDQLSTILNSNLNTNQIIKLRSLINNPKSKKFVLAYKYAESHGIENQNLTHEYGYLKAQLMEEGLSEAETETVVNGIEKKAQIEAGVARGISDAPTKPLEAKPAKKPAGRSETPTKPLEAKPAKKPGGTLVGRAKAPTVVKPAEKSPRRSDVSTVKPAKKPINRADVPTEPPKNKPKGTPINEVSQARLDDLGAKLKEIGLDDLAYVIAEPNIDRMPKRGADIRTFEQRQHEVNRLIKLDAQIKAETDFLRDSGLDAEAQAIENYKDSSKFKTLEKRLESAQELTKGIEDLFSNGISFTPDNAAKIIGLLNGTSQKGEMLHNMLVEHLTADIQKEASTKAMYGRAIDEMLKQVLGEINPKIKAKILELSKLKLLKPEDRAIMEANKENMTPELMGALISGGENFTAGGETVRIYKGAELGAGGMAKVNNVWFIQKPSNKLKKGVVKIPHPDTKVYFEYEAEMAGNLSSVLANSPAEKTKHIIKPLFATKDIIIYDKISNKKGETKDLAETMGTMSTKDWLTQFAGGVKGLAYLNKNGITHNDFKPANIVIGKNGGVVIDIGSFVFKTDIGTKIFTGLSNQNTKIALISTPNSGSIGVPTTPRYHDPSLLASSIDNNKPLDLADKFSVGTSLMDMLETKGYVKNLPDIGDHVYALNSGAPDSVTKIYNLAKQLVNCKNHPYKNIDNNPKKGEDPGYVKLGNLASKIKQLASTISPDEIAML